MRFCASFFDTHKADNIPETSPLYGIYQDWESRLSAALVDHWREKLAGLVEELRKAFPSKAAPPKYLDNKSFWDRWIAGYIALLLPFSEEAVDIGITDETQRIEEELTIGVDWGLANSRASEWAREHVAKLVKKRSRMFRQTLVDTDIENIRNEVANWIESQETFPDLVTRLEKIVVDPGRAELIGSTESTRAYAAGRSITWEGAGFIDPLQSQEAKDHFPLHPRCRCWPVFRPGVGVIHRTARDEHVCPICRPWSDKVVVAVKELA